jgi:hypothetical protein
MLYIRYYFFRFRIQTGFGIDFGSGMLLMKIDLTLFILEAQVI